jgi:hypothetical protein
LTDVGLLIDGHLTRVGAVVGAREQIVDEDGLIFFGSSAARELEVATGGEPGGTRAVGSTGAGEAVVLRETRAGSVGLCIARTVLIADDGEDGRNGRRSE